MLTVAGSESSKPSLTVKVNESGPAYPESGVYVSHGHPSQGHFFLTGYGHTLVTQQSAGGGCGDFNILRVGTSASAELQSVAARGRRRRASLDAGQ